MRIFLFFILTLLVSRPWAQSESVMIFSKTDYIKGNIYRQTNDTIKVTTEPIDIHFFKRHFYSPYYLPDKFINVALKNKTISVWRHPKGKRDYQRNWENKYTYDSLGRVTSYTYSGCLICSSFPYNFNVTYNTKGQVEKIHNIINSKESYRFYYDTKGDIIKLERYSMDMLETALVRVN